MAKVLLQCHPGFLGELPAQVERAATDPAGEVFEGWWLGKALREDCPGVLDAFPGSPLGTGAEQFSGRRLIEEERGDLDGLALKPGGSGRLEDRAVPEALDQGEQGGQHGLDRRESRLWVAIREYGGNHRVQMLGHGSDVLVQEVRGELYRDETVSHGRTSGCGKRSGTRVVEREVAWSQDLGPAGRMEFADAIEIKADLDTAWMKAARPVERAGHLEVVPLEAESKVPESSEQWTPSVADVGPGSRFTRAGGCSEGQGRAIRRWAGLRQHVEVEFRLGSGTEVRRWMPECAAGMRGASVCLRIVSGGLRPGAPASPTPSNGSGIFRQPILAW